MDWSVVESQNPWWADPDEIDRDEKIAEALSRKHHYLLPYAKGNQLIIGPRQTGKTTHLKTCIRELIRTGVDPRRCLYFTCNLAMGPKDVIDIVNLFSNIPGEKFAFLDEVSLVPGWERAVKHILEVKALHENAHFYFTGSTTLELQKERFPGRPIRIREFLPLSFRQFCGLFGSKALKEAVDGRRLRRLADTPSLAPSLLPHGKELGALFDKYIHCGGFLRPAYELVEDGAISEESYDIYWGWIAGDITRLGLSERTLGAVLKGVAARYATPFSLSSLAREFEIPSHVTARDYLELLESLHVLRSYWKSYGRAPAFRKERKVYFTDPFLYHVALFKTLGRKEETSEQQGKLVEGIVGEAVRRAGFEARFLRNRRELDFVSGEVGIEVKWQERVSASDFPAGGFRHKILLSKKEVEFGDVCIVPVPLFLALLG